MFFSVQSLMDTSVNNSETSSFPGVSTSPSESVIQSCAALKSSSQQAELHLQETDANHQQISNNLQESSVDATYSNCDECHHVKCDDCHPEKCELNQSCESTAAHKSIVHVLLDAPLKR